MRSYYTVVIDGMNPSCGPTVGAIKLWYKLVARKPAPSDDYIKRNAYFIRCACCKNADEFDSAFSSGKFKIWCKNKDCNLYNILSDPELVKIFPRWRWRKI